MITLDFGEQPFRLAQLLSSALAPYPSAQLVLTTAWVITLGEKRTVDLLPELLQESVVGTTLRFPPRLREMRDVTGRTGSILRHAAAYDLVNWLAIGDDFAGIPVNLMPRFLPVSNEATLAAPRVVGALRNWLAATAAANPPASGRLQ